MSTLFVIKGRLGNAIYRYMACSIFSIKYNLNYNTSINRNTISGNYNIIDITDTLFNKFIDLDSNNKSLLLDNNRDIYYKFSGYYQHDLIYTKWKQQLIEYIHHHKYRHYVLTDGINAGDGRHEQFYLKDIIDTPIGFNKFYDFVLHIRLGDKVNYGITLSLEAIKSLVKNITIPLNSCIVVNKPKTSNEIDFIEDLKSYIKLNNNVDIKVESNDILTDFHIMKNAKVLACSVSTLSWCAAYFSTSITKCYFPDYPSHVNDQSTCKHPIDNTELYNYQ